MSTTDEMEAEYQKLLRRSGFKPSQPVTEEERDAQARAYFEQKYGAILSPPPGPVQYCYPPQQPEGPPPDNVLPFKPRDSVNEGDAK